jgi:multidrug efflux pump
MRQGFGASIQKPFQFVIGGGTYAELAQWRDTLLEKIEADNPGLIGIDWDYKETKPQIQVMIDYDRAADLGVTIGDIGRTLETLLGSRRVTTYIDAGEQYDVILEGEREQQRSATDLQHIYVRSSRSGELIPLANLVTLSEFADSSTLNRYNRVRAITLEANLADGLALGDALAYMENLVKTHLPENVVIDYKGQSRDLKTSTQSIAFVFLLGILVVFLVLAAQFESYVNPLVIMLTVPLAMAGGVMGLYITGNTLNLYSQIGLIMLVGLAAKNGILIVEFANQLRQRRFSFNHAILKASEVRLRPIVMTGRRGRDAHGHRCGGVIRRADGHRVHPFRGAGGLLPALPENRPARRGRSAPRKRAGPCHPKTSQLSGKAGPGPKQKYDRFRPCPGSDRWSL